MNILALDPALTTGFAHTCGARGTWDLRGREGEAEGARLIRFLARLREAIASLGADCIAYEDAAYGSRNMLAHLFHAELRGVIKLAAAECGAKTAAFVPSTIKKFATGSGKAKKADMQRAWQRFFGDRIEDDNVVDACWILRLAEQGGAKRAAKKHKRREKKLGPARLF